ncbi:MAG: hypothetical protein ABGX22_17865, partial [Pirellulaceae bacterium]
MRNRTTIGLASLLLLLTHHLSSPRVSGADKKEVDRKAGIAAITVTGEVPDELSMFTDLMVNFV